MDVIIAELSMRTSPRGWDPFEGRVLENDCRLYRWQAGRFVVSHEPCSAEGSTVRAVAHCIAYKRRIGQNRSAVLSLPSALRLAWTAVAACVRGVFGLQHSS